MVLAKTLEIFCASSETAYQSLKGDSDFTVLLHHCGDVSLPFSDAISARLEQLLHDRIGDKKIEKRFFSVFLEILQNVRLHGVKDDQNRTFGSITIYRDSGSLYGKFSNLISKRDERSLILRYEELNSLDRTQLKQIYLNVMNDGSVSDKGGAGLGIIQAILKSKNPCKVSSKSISRDLCIFEVTTTVDFELQ
jgi:hypothetical protein